MADSSEGPNNARFQSTVSIGSEQIVQEELLDLTITSELDTPDVCALTLTKNGAKAHGPNLNGTDDFRVKIAHEGDDQDWAFVGELTDLDIVFSMTGSSGGTIVCRGVNAMHGLARGKRSCSYTKGDDGVTDKDIIDQVLSRNSSLTLTADYGKEQPKIRYPHVMQHNQTDLEFIRHRAARLGFFVLVRDKKLLFQKRDVTPSGLVLVLNETREFGEQGSTKIPILRFVARVSTANQVTEVRIRSYNPATRKEWIGVAPSSASNQRSLATKDGKSAISEKYPDSVMVRTDIPFSSQEEGNAIAAALLDERRLSYVTADGTIPGDARLRPGIVVELSTGDPHCDGKYFLTWVRHSYRANTPTAPFVTDFRAKRDATEPGS